MISNDFSINAEKIYNNLKPSFLDILEKKRIQCLSKYNSRQKINWRFNFWILTIIMIIDIAINGVSLTIVLYPFLFLFYITYMMLPLKVYKRKYNKLYNNKFVSEFLKSLYGYSYINKGDNLEDKLVGFKLVNEYHTYKGEDYIYGELDEHIKFNLEEVDIIATNGRVKGLVILLEIDKFINSRIIISSKNVYREEKLALDNYDEIKVDNKEFKDNFNIITNNKILAETVFNKKLEDKILETSIIMHDLFNFEFKAIAPSIKKSIENYKPTDKHKLGTGNLEIEIVGNKILMIIRGQYDLLAPASIKNSVFCKERLIILEQEINAIESLAKTMYKNIK